MKKYYWTGINILGENKTGITQALDEQNLKEILLAENIALLKAQEEKKSRFNIQINFGNKISLKQKALFFYQLSVLINNAIDINKALEIVINQIDSNFFKKIIDQIKQDIINGQNISDAMAKYPEIFDNSIIPIIKTGEESGKLGFVLEELANSLNQKIELKNKIIESLAMPIITIIFTIFIMLTIFTFIIPQFESIFSNMNKELPQTTIIILNISKILRSKYTLLSPILIYLLYFILSKFFTFNKTKKLKDKIFLKLVFIKDIVLTSNIIYFTQTLSLFLKSGISLKDAIYFSMQNIKNSYFKEKLELAYNDITQGKSFNESLAKNCPDIFPQNLISLIYVGENSSKLESVLQKITILLQKDLNSTLKTLTNIVQPVFMIIIGLLILFLMAAVYLPIFNMASLVG